ncbi:MAG: hypothetical protein ACXWUG_08140 [Polyangiales bacterium]
MLVQTSPPEARSSLRDSLRRWFHPRGVPAFVGCELPVIHQDGTLLGCDIAVALHHDPRPRRAWISSIEGRSLDVVFDLVTRGRLSDAIARATGHVERGVAEAFVFDASRVALFGFRRASDGTVDPIRTSDAGLRSRALDLHLVPRPEGLQLIHRVASIGELLDVVDRLDKALSAIQARRTQLAS